MTPGQYFAHDALDGYFESPHDAPPKWMCVLAPLLMYTAYLDETGQHAKAWIFVAGFLGQEDEWKRFVPRWKEGLGPQRKRLHMRKLRWSNPATETLLATLGPIPQGSGLKAVAGGVKYSDYEDLIVGTIVEKQSAGYLWCLFPLVQNILKSIPSDERVELIFGAQAIYKEPALEILELLEKTTLEDPEFSYSRTSSGLSKLAKWSFVPSSSTILLDPSDYYAYALTQYHLDQASKKTKWCTPILDVPHGMPYIGRILSRDEVRQQVINCKRTMARQGIKI